MGPPMRINWQLSKCPPADAHVRGAMETKMAAGYMVDLLKKKNRN
jgi:hypothetical protein